MEEHEPKISLVEIILILPYLLLLDAVGIVLILLGLDDFFILDIMAAPLLFYYFLKGVSATRYAVAAGLELIPYVGALPLYTIGFLLTVYLDRHPKLEAVVTKAAGPAGRTAVAGGARKMPAGASERTRVADIVPE